MKKYTVVCDWRSLGKKKSKILFQTLFLIILIHPSAIWLQRCHLEPGAAVTSSKGASFSWQHMMPGWTHLLFGLFCFLGPSSSSSRETLRMESSETLCSRTSTLDFPSCQSQSPKSSHLPALVVKSGKNGGNTLITNLVAHRWVTPTKPRALRCHGNVSDEVTEVLWGSFLKNSCDSGRLNPNLWVFFSPVKLQWPCDSLKLGENPTDIDWYWHILQECLTLQWNHIGFLTIIS